MDENLMSNQNNSKSSIDRSSAFKLGNVIVKEPKYRIGIDTYNEKANAYCLIRILDEKMDVILVKTISNKKEFDKEVKNLSKYFKAEIIKEAD